MKRRLNKGRAIRQLLRDTSDVLKVTVPSHEVQGHPGVWDPYEHPTIKHWTRMIERKYGAGARVEFETNWQMDYDRLVIHGDARLSANSDYRKRYSIEG